MTDEPRLQRVQPWWMQQGQPWAEQHLAASHIDALYRFGEFVLFVLMWNADDLHAGRVRRCPVCFEGNREAQAYDQAPTQDCEHCYGTTFEGGYRARVIRPAIVTDQDPEIVDSKRGEITTDTVRLQTTGDFYSRTGDFMFRSSGRRYQLTEMNTTDVRSGFEPESLTHNVGGRVGSARLEDRNAMAHRIEPDNVALESMIEQASDDWHLARHVGRQDLIRPGGYLVLTNP